MLPAGGPKQREFQRLHGALGTCLDPSESRALAEYTAATSVFTALEFRELLFELARSCPRSLCLVS